MKLKDTFTLDKKKRQHTDEGSVIFYNVPVARTGRQDYSITEFSGEDLALVEQYVTGGVVPIHRLKDDVAETASLDSYVGKWITVQHVGTVNNTNHKDIAVGRVLKAHFNDGHVLIDLVIDDEDVVDYIDTSGTVEMSPGYNTKLVELDGKLVQKDIRINHIALVPEGRCGKSCRIGDNKLEADMPDNLRKILVDGLSVETTEAGEQAIKKLQADAATSADTLQQIKDAHAQVIADKDKELGTKDAEIADLKSKALTPEQMDNAVADRAAVVAKVKSLGVEDSAITGKTDADLRKLAVAKKHPDLSLDGKSDDYVEALFDGIAVGDPMQTGSTQQPSNVGSATTNNATEAHAEMTQGLNDAWKGGQANA